MAALNESPVFAAQTPESDKFVIQDSELKNQQAYLAGHESDVSEFLYSQRAAEAEEVEVRETKQLLVGASKGHATDDAV